MKCSKEEGRNLEASLMLGGSSCEPPALGRAAPMRGHISKRASGNTHGLRVQVGKRREEKRETAQDKFQKDSD